MKKTLLTALFIVPAMSFAQTTIMSENFDSYADGDWAAVVSPIMSSWDGTTGAAPDCQITSSESNSPSNSIDINGPAGGGAIDPIVVFPSDYTSGLYLYSMKMKVASGFGGYFNVQASSTPGIAWIAEVYFNSNGSGYANAGGLTLNFTYTNNSWIDIDVLADLDADQGEIFIEGNSIGTFTWSAEAGGGGSTLSWGGMNLYAAADGNDACQYYVDDISLVQDPCMYDSDVTANGAVLSADMNGATYQWIDCNTGAAISGETGQSYTTTTNGSYACVVTACGMSDTSACVDVLYWGFEDVVSNPALNIVPNPSNGNFTVNYSDMNMANASVVIMDVLGSRVYSSNASVVGNGAMEFDLDLENGVYFVTFVEGSNKLTKRVVVRK